MEYKASIVIDAPPDRIWKIITDVARYPEWDPACERIEGEIAIGRKLKVFTKLSPDRAFPVKVVELLPGSTMKWVGGMPLGLFKGVRTFTLCPANDGQVSFTLHEVFSGPLLPLIGKAIPDLTEAFHRFVIGLKSRAEAGAS